MSKEDTRDYLSSDQDMARALFNIAKRAWYKSQRESDAKHNRSRPEPPPNPVPGQGWYADPSTLQIQVDPFRKVFHEGSSVKIYRGETEIHRAFRPRPFLIISHENLLDQRRAWVCPLSTSAQAHAPDWVVPLPELQTNALASKIHTIDTEFFPDVAERDLLRTMENREIASSVISVASQKRVRAAIETYLSGTFAPKTDNLPPGSIVRFSNGSERIVLASCYLGDFYRGAGTLSMTCRLLRTLPPKPDRTKLGIVPLFSSPASSGKGPEKPPEPVGYLDLGRVASQMQDRLIPLATGRIISILPEALKAFRGLLMGGTVEEESK